MNNLDKLKNFIKKSKLSAKDTEYFISFFAKAEDKDLDLVIEVLRENPDWILKINKNIKDKARALKKQDQKAWDKIIAQEKIDLLRTLARKT